MRFGLLGAVTRGVRRYVIFSELNFVVPTLVKKSGPVCFPDKAIVIEFIDHNSFPLPELDQIPS